MIRRSFVFVFCLSVVALVAACRRAPALPDYGAVPAFSMTDQSGKAVTAESFRGKVWAAAFIFTRCPSACPRVTRAMSGVQQDAKRRNFDLRLVSFSIDPDNDTPAVLAKYASEYGADTTTWSFLTGDVESVRATAEQGFKIAAQGSADPSKADFGITHGTQLVLVDGALRIRGYYSTSEDEPLRRIVDDAAKLAGR